MITDDDGGGGRGGNNDDDERPDDLPISEVHALTTESLAIMVTDDPDCEAAPPPEHAEVFGADDVLQATDDAEEEDEDNDESGEREHDQSPAAAETRKAAFSRVRSATTLEFAILFLAGRPEEACIALHNMCTKALRAIANQPVSKRSTQQRGFRALSGHRLSDEAVDQLVSDTVSAALGLATNCSLSVACAVLFAGVRETSSALVWLAVVWRPGGRAGVRACVCVLCLQPHRAVAFSL